jgi:hypothetical protein
MTRNPFLNALAAAGYIACLGLLAQYGLPNIPEPVSPLPAIITFLSVFVFSVAVMGYTLLSMPLRLLIEGEKKEAIALFLKTLLAFALVSAAAASVALLLPAPPVLPGE